VQRGFAKAEKYWKEGDSTPTAYRQVTKRCTTQFRRNQRMNDILIWLALAVLEVQFLVLAFVVFQPCDCTDAEAVDAEITFQPPQPK